MAGVYQGFGAGSFGAVGGTITFDWVPEPEVVADQVFAIAGYLDNTAGPIALSREVVRADIRDHFAQSGPGWEPWAREYPDSQSILHRDGALESASTGDAVGMTESDVFFDFGALPEYGPWNNFGATRRTQASEGDVEFLRRAQALGMHVAEDHGLGGNILPARPFAWIGEGAELDIVEIFDAWFNGALGIGGYRNPTTGRFTSQSAAGARPFGRWR